MQNATAIPAGLGCQGGHLKRGKFIYIALRKPRKFQAGAPLTVLRAAAAAACKVQPEAAAGQQTLLISVTFLH